MRAMPILCLVLCASAATAHAQDRYSMRGVTVSREAPASRPASENLAPEPGFAAVAPAPQAVRAPVRYLNWPGKRDAQLLPSPAAAPMPVVAQSAPIDRYGRAPAPAEAAPTRRAVLVAPMPSATSSQAYAPRAANTAAPQARSSAPSIYDPAPAPAPPMRQTQAQQTTRSQPARVTPAAYQASAPRAAEPAPAQAQAAQPAARVSRAAPVRWDQRPEYAGNRTHTDPTPVVMASATPPSARAAPVRWDLRPENRRSAPAAQPATQAVAAAVPAPAAAGRRSTARNTAIPLPAQKGAAPAPAPVQVAARESYGTANGGTRAKFYSVHREFGQTPDPIVMPKQFFLDGTPDMAKPPPLPVPRITPTSGQSTAVQRAAAERSQEDPDQPIY